MRDRSHKNLSHSITIFNLDYLLLIGLVITDEHVAAFPKELACLYQNINRNFLSEKINTKNLNN